MLADIIIYLTRTSLFSILLLLIVNSCLPCSKACIELRNRESNGAQVILEDVDFRRDIFAISTMMTSQILKDQGNSSPTYFNLVFLKQLRRLQAIGTLEDADNPKCHRSLVARDFLTNSVIGYVDIDRRIINEDTQRLFPRPYISDLIVAEEWRGRGVGMSLLNKCQEIAEQDWSTPFTYLLVERDRNIAATNLYRKSGFVEVIPTIKEHLEKGVVLHIRKSPISQRIK